MGRAMEDAQSAIAVEGEETFTSLLRKDLPDRLIGQLEVAYVLQLRLAIVPAHHEPLADATGRVADHQRYATEQRGYRGDFTRATEQLVAAIELLAAQVEDIDTGPPAYGEPPHVTRVDAQQIGRAHV